jgi:hypothetical protein
VPLAAGWWRLKELKLIIHFFESALGKALFRFCVRGRLGLCGGLGFFVEEAFAFKAAGTPTGLAVVFFRSVDWFSFECFFTE